MPLLSAVKPYPTPVCTQCLLVVKSRNWMPTGWQNAVYPAAGVLTSMQSIPWHQRSIVTPYSLHTDGKPASPYLRSIRDPGSKASHPVHESDSFKCMCSCRPFTQGDRNSLPRLSRRPAILELVSTLVQNISKQIYGCRFRSYGLKVSS